RRQARDVPWETVPWGRACEASGPHPSEGVRPPLKNVLSPPVAGREKVLSPPVAGRDRSIADGHWDNLDHRSSLPSALRRKAWHRPVPAPLSPKAPSPVPGKRTEYWDVPEQNGLSDTGPAASRAAHDNAT